MFFHIFNKIDLKLKKILNINKMRDYNQSKIYKIINEELKGLVYYGSTTAPLKQRYTEHKSKSNNCSSKIMFSVGTPEIILLEEYPCSSKEELIKRERYWIEGNECVNHHIPGRTLKEYRDDNKNLINKQMSEKNNCECGGKYTYGHKSVHMKTKKHIKFISLKKPLLDALDEGLPTSL